MKHHHLWIAFLLIQLLSVTHTMGQELVADTSFVEDARLDNRDWQLPANQPMFQIEEPELLNTRETPFETSHYSEEISFHFYAGQMNLNNLKGDSSTLFVPKYPGIGDYQNFGGNLGRLHFNEKLALDYGAFISAQYGFLFSSKQIVFGSNYMLRYSLSNKLYFQSWGQYVTPGNSNDPTFDLPHFFPKSHFGAGLLYDSNKKTQIDMGVEYRYDQQNNTWKPESGGKVRIQF